MSYPQHTSTRQLNFFPIFRYTTKLQIIIVMGFSWILELINLYYYHESVKILIDLYNILRGFMVFYIIVYKRPVIHEFKRRIGQSIDPFLFSMVSS